MSRRTLYTKGPPIAEDTIWRYKTTRKMYRVILIAKKDRPTNNEPYPRIIIYQDLLNYEIFAIPETDWYYYFLHVEK